eukprot:scaffold110191_cov64-Phaeocystis_antarctica.AAC.3
MGGGPPSAAHSLRSERRSRLIFLSRASSTAGRGSGSARSTDSLAPRGAATASESRLLPPTDAPAAPTHARQRFASPFCSSCEREKADGASILEQPAHCPCAASSVPLVATFASVAALLAALLAELMAALAASARSASEMHDLQRTGAPLRAHAPASIRLLNLLWSSSAQVAQEAMSDRLQRAATRLQDARVDGAKLVSLRVR